MRNRKPEFQYSWKMSRLTRIFPLLFVSLSPYKHFLLHWTPNSSSFSSLLFAMSEDPFPGSLYVTMYARKMGAFPTQHNRSDSRLNMLCKQQQPNQQRTLNKFLTELRCRKFCQEAPTEHTNRAPNVQKTRMQCVCIPTQLPFCTPPLVVGNPLFRKQTLQFIT